MDDIGSKNRIQYVRHAVEWARMRGIAPRVQVKSFHQVLKRLWMRYCKIRGANGAEWITFSQMLEIQCDK